jgi:multidrug resistance efflux pump
VAAGQAERMLDTRGDASSRLAQLVAHPGPLDVFWSDYLSTLGEAAAARRVVLLKSAMGRPWQAQAQWPSRVADGSKDAEWTLELLRRLDPGSGVPHVQAVSERGLAFVMPIPVTTGSEHQLVVIAGLDVDRSRWHEAALCAWTALALGIARQALTRLASPPAQTPPLESDQAAAVVDPTSPDRTELLHQIMRAALRLQHEQRFMSMAMGLCNELATRYGCERVSLGWVHGHYVKLTAVSHIEHFDAKAQATRAIEAAMEEAFDQDSMLIYPAHEGEGPVLRAHAAYCESVGQTHLATLPFGPGETVDAVLCFERATGALREEELWELEIFTSSLAQWLTLLQKQDRWFGARWWGSLVCQGRQFFRPRNTVAKFAVLASVIALLSVLFVTWPYRVDAGLAIRSQDLLHMPAPFDGYLREVRVQIGDPVTAGDVLVELDTKELALEASMAESDLVRHAREAEKAMAAQQLAEMQIASARAQQATARLEMLRYQLGHAQLRAPFDGVVIEGDLRRNLGAPVKKGDLLLKVAQTRSAYIELEIDQVVVHEVAVGSRGEFALVGRPGERYGITLTRIDPAALTRDGRTFYLARAELDGGFKSHWRPGMNGTAKLEAGQRTVLWLMTHRTVRFLKEYFWL